MATSDFQNISHQQPPDYVGIFKLPCIGFVPMYHNSAKKTDTWIQGTDIFPSLSLVVDFVERYCAAHAQDGLRMDLKPQTWKNKIVTVVPLKKDCDSYIPVIISQEGVYCVHEPAKQSAKANLSSTQTKARAIAKKMGIAYDHQQWFLSKLTLQTSFQIAENVAYGDVCLEIINEQHFYALSYTISNFHIDSATDMNFLVEHLKGLNPIVAEADQIRDIGLKFLAENRISEVVKVCPVILRYIPPLDDVDVIITALGSFVSYMKDYILSLHDSILINNTLTFGMLFEREFLRFYRSVAEHHLTDSRIISAVLKAVIQMRELCVDPCEVSGCCIAHHIVPLLNEADDLRDPKVISELIEHIPLSFFMLSEKFREDHAVGLAIVAKQPYLFCLLPEKLQTHPAIVGAVAEQRRPFILKHQPDLQHELPPPSLMTVENSQQTYYSFFKAILPPTKSIIIPMNACIEHHLGTHLGHSNLGDLEGFLAIIECLQTLIDDLYDGELLTPLETVLSQSQENDEEKQKDIEHCRSQIEHCHSQLAAEYHNESLTLKKWIRHILKNPDGGWLQNTPGAFQKIDDMIRAFRIHFTHLQMKKLEQHLIDIFDAKNLLEAYPNLFVCFRAAGIELEQPLSELLPIGQGRLDTVKKKNYDHQYSGFQNLSISSKTDVSSVIELLNGLNPIIDFEQIKDIGLQLLKSGLIGEVVDLCPVILRYIPPLDDVDVITVALGKFVSYMQAHMKQVHDSMREVDSSTFGIYFEEEFLHFYLSVAKHHLIHPRIVSGCMEAIVQMRALCVDPDKVSGCSIARHIVQLLNAANGLCDPKVISSLMEHIPFSFFMLSEKFREDRAVGLAIVAKQPYLFCLLPNQLQKDPLIVRAVAEQCRPFIVKYHPELKDKLPRPSLMTVRESRAKFEAFFNSMPLDMIAVIQKGDAVDTSQRELRGSSLMTVMKSRAERGAHFKATPLDDVIALIQKSCVDDTSQHRYYKLQCILSLVSLVDILYITEIIDPLEEMISERNVGKDEILDEKKQCIKYLSFFERKALAVLPLL